MPDPRYITVDGETKRLAEWQREFGVPPWLFYRRIRKGMTEEEALRAGPPSKRVGAVPKPIGKHYGELTVYRKAKSRHRNAWSWCRCSCGSRIRVRNTDLRLGKVTHCGCLNEEWIQIGDEPPVRLDQALWKIRISREGLRTRLKKGWSFEEAITTPNMNRARRFKRSGSSS